MYKLNEKEINSLKEIALYYDREELVNALDKVEKIDLIDFNNLLDNILDFDY